MVEQREARGFAVAHPVHRVVGELEAGPDAVTEGAVVFNQQDAHLLLFLFEFREQRLDFLAATAVGQFAARPGRRLERLFEMAACASPVRPRSAR
jgi:hypothetical protein